MSTGKSISIGLSATCSDDTIVLRFDRPGSYRIWRKRPADPAWGAPIWERPTGTQWVDHEIEPGVAFEYKVVEMMTGAIATAYILAGSRVPLVDNRGSLVLVVERTHAEALKSELEQFVRDLVGDGYTVIRRDVSRTDSPESVKALIKLEYDADPANVRTVILLGAVPVQRSGNYTYDGHPDHVGAMAADTFYGSFGDWSGSPSTIPAQIKLALGRLDFSMMTCYANKPENPRSELDLLRQYLNRNHAFRTGQWSVTPRGAIRDGFPDWDFSANGWRNFPQLVGTVQEIKHFFETLAEDTYLLAYACGGGQFTSMDGVGGSDDFATHDIKCVFLGLLGSYFLDWNNESNFLRAAIGSGKCLCAFGAGAPHVFLHRMALGGTIGESYLLSENNFVVYPPTGNAEDGPYAPAAPAGWSPGGVHQGLMGDPTLTLYPVKPVSNLAGHVLDGKLNLAWTPSFASDEVESYHVYRSASANGPFARLTGEPITANGYTVADHFEGMLYMVRAVKLVQTPSGSYYGASCGMFWPETSTQPQPPIPTPGKIMSKAKFIEIDAETQGNWPGKYGFHGGSMASGVQRLPLYAGLSAANAPTYAWSTDSEDRRALQSGQSMAEMLTRIAAVWTHDIGFTVEIKSDATTHRLALYFLDWDRAGRRQRVEILDATDYVLDRRDVLAFGDGVWLVYEFQGSVKIRLTKLAGPNAVLSALVFDPVPTAPIPPTSADVRTLDVLCSTDRGATWRVVQTTKIDTTGTDGAMFKLAIR